MNALIVGADRIEPIRRELVALGERLGITRTEHWSGRSVGDTRKSLSRDTRLVVVICDRLNHQLLRHVRKQAERLGVPLVYARHSLVDLRERIGAAGL